MSADQTLPISADLDGQTLSAALRRLIAGLSWAQAKRLIVGRRVHVNSTLCLNDARRLKTGEVVTILEQADQPLPTAHQVRLLHIDQHLVVVDKPAGVVTLRHRDEEDFSHRRKELQPSLEELVQRLLPGKPAPKSSRPARRPQKSAPAWKLYPVHRLDRDTSGLMLFALSPQARDLLIDMFSRHLVRRTYLAVVLGIMDRHWTIESDIIRDRGDGLRGSIPRGKDDDPTAENAITHVCPLEQIGGRYTMVECRLQTGRTHQIRIHLAEIGHMLCGEKLYLRPRPDAPLAEDLSCAPRQALHSTDLDFIHPITRKPMHFVSPLPPDLANWLTRLRKS